MGRWKADKDAFSNGLLETDTTVFHMLDIDNETEALRLLGDIAERHNADCAAYEATIAELTFDRDSEKRWACQYKAERDAATAQVAELARQTVTLQQDRDTANQRVAELEALYIDNTISVLQGKLSALNATLDRLREVVRLYDDSHEDWEYGDLVRFANAVYCILYPQPQPPEQTP